MSDRRELFSSITSVPFPVPISTPTSQTALLKFLEMLTREKFLLAYRQLSSDDEIVTFVRSLLSESTAIDPTFTNSALQLAMACCDAWLGSRLIADIVNHKKTRKLNRKF